MTLAGEPAKLNGPKEHVSARDYGILDTAPEGLFDDVVSVATAVCEAPMAFMSFIDGGRQWFKAKRGFGISELPLARPACRFTIEDRHLLVIRDLSVDTRTRADRLVTDEPGLRFYAGAPLVEANGAIIGTLCILDIVARPNGLNDTQLMVLETLATQAVAHLEARRFTLDSMAQRRRSESFSLRATGDGTATSSAGVFDIDVRTGIVTPSESMCHMFGLPAAQNYQAKAFEVESALELRGLRVPRRPLGRAGPASVAPWYERSSWDGSRSNGTRLALVIGHAVATSCDTPRPT